MRVYGANRGLITKSVSYWGGGSPSKEVGVCRNIVRSTSGEKERHRKFSDKLILLIIGNNVLFTTYQSVLVNRLIFLRGCGLLLYVIELNTGNTSSVQMHGHQTY